MAFDWNKGSDVGTVASAALALLTALGGLVVNFIFPTKSYVYRTFQTKADAQAHEEAAAKAFVKITEPDGTRNYLHPTDLVQIREMVEGNQAFVKTEMSRLAKQLTESDFKKWEKLENFLDTVKMLKDMKDGSPAPPDGPGGN